MALRLRDLGEGALLLDFGDRIVPALSAQVTAAAAALRRLELDGVTDLVPSYASLGIHFDPLRLPRERLVEALRGLAGAGEAEAAGRLQEIPVAFGAEAGPDLEDVARACGRPPAQVVAALCARPLRVFLIGFLPGFPYLGELPEWLRVPRLDTPRTAVPRGSVAIAGGQAAIYPCESPGGWRILGRTPVPLFDAADPDQPALLRPGDRVRFRALPEGVQPAGAPGAAP